MWLICVHSQGLSRCHRGDVGAGGGHPTPSMGRAHLAALGCLRRHRTAQNFSVQHGSPAFSWERVNSHKKLVGLTHTSQPDGIFCTMGRHAQH